MNLFKAFMYTGLATSMTWCWDFGHSYWWGILVFVWCLLMATDVVQAALPKKGG